MCDSFGQYSFILKSKIWQKSGRADLAVGNAIRLLNLKQVFGITRKQSMGEKFIDVTNAAIVPSIAMVWTDTKKLFMMESYINVRTVKRCSLK